MFGPCTDILALHLICCGAIRRLRLKKKMSHKAGPEQLAYGKLCTALVLALAALEMVIFEVYQSRLQSLGVR